MAELEVVEEFNASLVELNSASRPLISMLTMIAEDSRSELAAAKGIVGTVEKRIATVPATTKLPVMYLLDSIVKNVALPYRDLFSRNLVDTFCHVFEHGDEVVRKALYKLRQTWNGVFSVDKLWAIDKRVRVKLDPAWPITANLDQADSSKSSTTTSMAKTAANATSKTSTTQSHQTKTSVSVNRPLVRQVPPLRDPRRTTAAAAVPVSVAVSAHQIHINPNFVSTQHLPASHLPSNGMVVVSSADQGMSDLQSDIIKRQKQLLELEKKRLELQMREKEQMLVERERELADKERRLREEQRLAASSTPPRKRGHANVGDGGEVFTSTSVSAPRHLRSSVHMPVVSHTEHNHSQTHTSNIVSNLSNQSNLSKQVSLSDSNKLSLPSQKQVTIKGSKGQAVGTSGAGSSSRRADSAAARRASRDKEREFKREKELGSKSLKTEKDSERDWVRGTGGAGAGYGTSGAAVKEGGDMTASVATGVKGKRAVRLPSPPAPKKIKQERLSESGEAPSARKRSNKNKNTSNHGSNKKNIHNVSKDHNDSTRPGVVPRGVLGPVTKVTPEMLLRSSEFVDPNILASQRPEGFDLQPTTTATNHARSSTTAAERSPPEGNATSAAPTLDPFGFPFSRDIDYRQEFRDVMSRADEELRSGRIDSYQHQALVGEVQRAWTSGDFANFEFGSRPPVDPTNQISPPYSAQGPHGPPVSATTTAPTIYEKHPDEIIMEVDGARRKLFYYDDQMAIVLMGIPFDVPFDHLVRIPATEVDPRKISFQGKGVRVFIDSERALPGTTPDSVFLEFNSKGRTFFNGDYEQRIKIGGPAREIVLNGHWYQAKFGGPPVEVWFHGDHLTPHTLTLEGPAPRVDISTDTYCRLWGDILGRLVTPQPIRPISVAPIPTPLPLTHQYPSSDGYQMPLPPSSPSGPVPVSSAPPKPSVDINKLLSNLMAKGLINKPFIGQNATDEASKSSSTTISSAPEPPIKFNVESLRIRRKTVIDGLYLGIQCTNCSLRFDENQAGGRDRYSKHLDWHFRQNRREKNRPAQVVLAKRAWYYTVEQWCLFREISDADYDQPADNLSRPGSATGDNSQSSSPDDVPITVPESTEEALNSCACCFEKFDRVWNDDEEQWMLKGAITHSDGKNYHGACIVDAGNVHEPEPEVDSQPQDPNPEDEPMATETTSLPKDEPTEEKVEIPSESENQAPMQNGAVTITKQDILNDLLEDSKPSVTVSSPPQEEIISPTEVIKAGPTTTEAKEEMKYPSPHATLRATETKSEPLLDEATPSPSLEGQAVSSPLEELVSAESKEEEAKFDVRSDLASEPAVNVVVRGEEMSALCSIM